MNKIHKRRTPGSPGNPAYRQAGLVANKNLSLCSRTLVANKNLSLCSIGFINSLAVLAYVSLVALVMSNGDRIFGEFSNIFGPIAFLLLFVVSALVVASLVLGKPVMLYLDGRKKEALSLFFATSCYLGAYMIIVLLVAILRNIDV